MECKLTVTNTADKALTIKPGEWFSVKIEQAAYFMTYDPTGRQTVLKPQESVSQPIRLFEAQEREAQERGHRRLMVAG